MTDCRLGLTLGAAALALFAGSAGAETTASLAVYPLGHAAILAGQRFDFKVEFPTAIAAADAKVTINGRTPAQLFGKEPTFVEKEAKADASGKIHEGRADGSQRLSELLLGRGFGLDFDCFLFGHTPVL